MKIFSGIEEKKINNKIGIISIGVFDSIHRGHQKLLKNMVDIAKDNNFETYVLTFRIPPVKDNLPKILELEDRLTLIEEMGIDNVILCDFNDEFSNMKPVDFTNKLKNNYNITNYYIGEDFKFGHNKSGNKEFLKQLGFNVFVEPTFIINDKKVSTSDIKKYIIAGEIEQANILLGRNFSIKGFVRMGKQLGRKLGFPTMNITNSEIIYPKNATYITTTKVEGKIYPSMTFVDTSIIETHLFGYDKFDYNFEITIDFFKKIRDNRVYENLEELVKQLEIDKIETKKYFNI